MSAQKRGGPKFKRQVAARLHEGAAMAKARRENNITGINDERLTQLDENGEKVIPQKEKKKLLGGTPILGGSSVTVQARAIGGELHPAMNRFVQDYLSSTEDNSVVLYSECTTPLLDEPHQRRHTFRAHRNSIVDILKKVSHLP